MSKDRCPRCEAKLAKKARFCHDCGNRIAAKTETRKPDLDSLIGHYLVAHVLENPEKGEIFGLYQDPKTDKLEYVDLSRAGHPLAQDEKIQTVEELEKNVDAHHTPIDYLFTVGHVGANMTELADRSDNIDCIVCKSCDAKSKKPVITFDELRKHLFKKKEELRNGKPIFEKAKKEDFF